MIMRCLFIYRTASLDITDPMGLMHMVAAVKRAGHQTDLLLSNLERDLFRSVREFAPDVIGFSVTSGSEHYYLELIRRLRRQVSFVSIFGGPHPTFFPEIVEEPEVDVICRGEGDLALPEMLDRMERGRDYADVAGLWVKRDGEVVKNNMRPPIASLDELPFADRESLGKYFAYRRSSVKHFLAGRGCPYDCLHCSSNPGRGTRPKVQRRLEPSSIKRLIEALVVRFQASRLHVLDEMINVHPGHLDTVLDALLAYDVELDLPNGLRADHLTTSQIDAMAPRMSILSVSAESGSRRVVEEEVGKRLRLSEIERVVAAARQKGLPTLVHFIIGIPGETAEEINATLEMAIDLHERFGAYPAVQYATPLPGTALFEKAPVPAPPDKDWGPLFQHEPMTSGEGFGPEDLAWFKWTFNKRLDASSSQRKVILNVTYRCNNRCVFCAVGNRSKVDGNFDEQKEILLRHRELGVDALDIDGGEPTLYKHLLPLVGFARKAGYRSVNVTTNGRMCAYEGFARKLVQSGLTTLLFSLHGANEVTHGELVGVREGFEQTVAGARNCMRSKPAEVTIGMNVTITRSNLPELLTLGRLARRLGLCWLNLQFLTPFGRATRDIAPDPVAAAREAMKVIDALGAEMTIRVVNLPFCFMPGYEEHLVGDLLKSRRKMIFVNKAEVNLHEYLLARRYYLEKCAACRHRIFCGGLYELDSSPEPAWAIEHEPSSEKRTRT